MSEEENMPEENAKEEIPNSNTVEIKEIFSPVEPIDEPGTQNLSHTTQ